MATDIAQVVAALTAFYDFAGKTVIDIGAGGGQLVEYARTARRVIAIDHDTSALARLRTRLLECGLSTQFELVASDLYDVRTRGDVVLFEFCLHEMADPARALVHAHGLAPDVVVIDHAPGSPWSWCAAEDDGVEAAWEAVAGVAVRREHDVAAWQRFSDYAELESRLAHRGPESLRRIATLRAQADISIPMPYRIALLHAS